jgi:hypothetical protein
MSASPAEIPSAEGAMSPSQLFVINLCASTSPMALAQPNVPALKRYTFFVSRQRDDGRDRFRLHMGYFASQEEAEQMLDAVRDVYPAAWAGPAPASGAPRRGRTAVTPVPVVPIATAAARPAASKPVQSPAVPAQPVESMTESAVKAVPVPPVLTPVNAPQPQPDVLDAMSNVREVLAKLDETPATRMETAEDADKSALGEGDVLRVLEESAKSVAESGRFLTQPQAQVRLLTPEDTQSQSDIQNDVESNAPPCFAVQLVWSVSPIDVTRLPHLAIFDAYTLYNVEGNRDGRKWYGVRLGFFSDQAAASQVASYVRSDYRAVAIVPVAVKEREGAGGDVAKKTKAAPRQVDQPKQVDTPKQVSQPTLESDTVEGFQLLEDDRPAPLKLDLDDKPSAHAGANVPVAKPIAAAVSKPGAVPVAKPAAKPVIKPAAKAPARADANPVVKPVARVAGKPSGKPVGKRAVARKRPPPPPGAPNPLESTLEILGASTLTLDESREIINDSAVRKPLVRKSGNRFSRLLDRLSGN